MRKMCILLLLLFAAGCEDGWFDKDDDTIVYDTPILQSEAPDDNGDSDKDARLSKLTVDEDAIIHGNLDPSFSSSKTSYIYEAQAVSDVTFDVTPTAEQSGATITVDGNPVNSGDTESIVVQAGDIDTVDIVITAKDGVTTKTYTVEMTVIIP